MGDEENDSQSEMAAIVASQYELVRRILANLPESSLEACEQVSKLWKDAVKSERNAANRKRIAMFSWTGKATTTAQYAMHEMQGSENHLNCYQALEDWKKQERTKPHISVTISVGDPLGGPDDVQNFISDPFKISKTLGSRNVQISSSGVIVGPNEQPPKETENLSSSKETPVLGTITFPHFDPNLVKIIPFSYSELEISPKKLQTATFKELTGCSEIDDTQVKCIVFMSNVLSIQRTSRLIQVLGEATERQLAIGGCIGNLAHDSGDKATFADLKDMLQAMEDCNEDNPGKYARTVGLIFAGSHVRAASVLLSTQTNTKSKVEQELKKFKEVGFNERNSCAFMFACCGRGRNFYKGKGNVESEVFKQLYPNTPLLGIFGNGEIGLTYLPVEIKDTFSDPSASKRGRKGTFQPKEFSHSFTTVFVMLSFLNK